MPYDPQQTAAADQIRGMVGDTADPPILSGGEERYEAIAAAAASVAAGALVAARELRRQLALRPRRRSAEGVSVDYGELIADLDRLITKLESDAQAAAGAARGPQIGRLTATGNGEMLR